MWNFYSKALERRYSIVKPEFLEKYFVREKNHLSVIDSYLTDIFCLLIYLLYATLQKFKGLPPLATVKKSIFFIAFFWSISIWEYVLKISSRSEQNWLRYERWMRRIRCVNDRLVCQRDWQRDVRPRDVRPRALVKEECYEGNTKFPFFKRHRRRKNFCMDPE